MEITHAPPSGVRLPGAFMLIESSTVREDTIVLHNHHVIAYIELERCSCVRIVGILNQFICQGCETKKVTKFCPKKP
jgi:hypothetical protein